VNIETTPLRFSTAYDALKRELQDKKRTLADQAVEFAILSPATSRLKAGSSAVLSVPRPFRGGRTAH
jgi:hypothetical protein